jgi:hypothetical protein
MALAPSARLSEITKAVRHLATAFKKDAEPIHHQRLKLKTGAKHNSNRGKSRQKYGMETT